MKKFYSDLPQWAKGVVGVVAVVGTAAVVITVYRKVVRANAAAKDNAVAKDAEQELQVLLRNGGRLSYGVSQYEAFSQILVEAMRGCATDEEKVYGVFRNMRTKEDVLKLISAFGIRQYEVCAGLNPISAAQQALGFGKDIGGSIISWLNYDMTNSEIAKINDILAKKGINYKF